MTDTREEYERLFDLYLPIALAVFAIVLVALVYVVLRFRSRSTDFPEGKSSDARIEISYVVVIGLIVAGLLAVTFTSMSDLSSAERSGDGPTIEVTAAKWNWRFDYPEYDVRQTARGRAIAMLAVPVDTNVRFRLTSSDVIHAFWVPERRFKRDAFPNRTTTFTLRFPELGFSQAGECAQFCGLDHSSMDFNVNVLGKAEFRRWVALKRAEARE